MGREIERKFLVIGEDWRRDADDGTRFVQGYLSLDPERIVRVRMEGDEGRLTIKGLQRGISRLEFEYPIPSGDARALLPICTHPPIEKTRYRVKHGGWTWEVDVFEGPNTGLRVAELELPSEDASFDRPPWVGPEVSDDPRYSNSSLVTHPYAAWGSSGIHPG